jgi:nucleotide-binding universal stress UspA family protein
MVDDRTVTGEETWVVGVDGSVDSVRAVRWAVHNAPGRAAKLRVVRAWSIPTTGELTVLPSMIDDFRPESAYDALDDLAAELEPNGITVDARIDQGPASTVLLEACDDADLLVVGTRGLGGFSRLLLGSTSQQCATHARVPVVVVPAAFGSDAAARRVVVGMDASAGARAALEWAFDFAPPDMPIRVLGAWSHSGWIGTDKDGRPTEAQEALAQFNAAVDEVESRRSAPGHCRRNFVEGHAAEALLDAEVDADLLVVGERGRRGLTAALLGSVTTEVLHRAGRPVVVVPVDD